MSAPTDWQRLLAVLSDRRPHSSNELYDLRMVVHSRVADLRRRGYDVSCWKFGKGYWYRLVSAPGEQQDAA